jgi:hypothetical protein
MLKMKRVHSDSLRQEVFALRYRAYLNEDAIDKCPTEKFEDKYDSQPNNILWALSENERLVGSIRTTWFDPVEPWSIPEIDGYREDFDRSIPGTSKVLSGNRFVTDPTRGEQSSSWAMILLRHHLLVSASKADYAVAAVRANHLPFYRRILGLEKISEGRTYPGLKSTMYLTSCDIASQLEGVYQKTPKLKSHGYERLFIDESYKDIWEVGLPIEI